MNPATQLTGKRIMNLFRYEFIIHKKMYAIGIPAMFLLVVVSFLVVFSTTNGFGAFYYLSLLFIVIFGVGQSFLDLRDKSSAQIYLLLPGSAAEKFLIQFITRVILLPVVFTVLFILGVELSKALFHLSSITTIKGDFPVLEIDELSVSRMIFVFHSWNKPLIVYLLFFGVGGLLISLMFAGGIIFGKWNSFFMPLSIFIFWLLMVASFVTLSWLVVGFPTAIDEFFSIRLELYQFEIFEGPLLIVVFIVLVWLAIPWAYWVAYLKLKERQV
ncbi:hypothetical protein [Algoriphagus sp. Y33]|uniref:hypothetical protein n=1 Tax=Algoriphagus sp. Y33 TaxID=2772483 RepID=UPI0017814435|nr:hypothetical protein [Algoriphagus sp. Y33]